MSHVPFRASPTGTNKSGQRYAPGQGSRLLAVCLLGVGRSECHQKEGAERLKAVVMMVKVLLIAIAAM